jgi:ribosomal-protein-serine acetyltransferase
MTIHLDERTRLELTAERHAHGLFAAVNNNRIHLSEFLPWVDHMQSVDDFSKYVRNCEVLYLQNKEVSFVVILDEIPVGRIGLHYINLQNRNASIGYWLTKDAEGKGIMIRACKEIVTYGFEKLGLHRIELMAAVNNLRSQAIPEKLGFSKEGILRQAEFVNNVFVDLYMYSMLDFEWAALTSA